MMTRWYVYAVLGGLSGMWAAHGAHAAQVTLTPSNVYAFSDAFGAPFAADNVLDQQSGTITETFGDTSYWLASNDGPAVGFISIDLGAEYLLSRFDLFNTHNGSVNDRGTGDFEIRGSNDAAFTTYSTLVSGTLAAQASANDPLDSQTFEASSGGAFRYIQFRATGVASATPICCGIRNNYGLNEIRVFGDQMVAGAVPEPSTWAMLILGFGILGSLKRSSHRASGPVTYSSS